MVQLACSPGLPNDHPPHTLRLSIMRLTALSSPTIALQVVPFWPTLD